eukprot:870175_1
MAAINVGGTVAFSISPGSMNRFKLFAWLAVCLLPKCSPYPGPNSVIVCDNASFHRSTIVKALCTTFGVKIVYLPPYSPHLNVIELLFNALKQNLRKYPQLTAQNVRLVAMLFMIKLKNINWRGVAS